MVAWSELELAVEAERMVWCLLTLAALVALEVMGLRRFYARLDPRDRCHCDRPWRGEFIANFGHEPEVSPLAPVASPVRVRASRPPFKPRIPGIANRVGRLRHGSAV
jgi:hypothetical protein